jgi:hypothetical protein
MTESPPTNRAPTRQERWRERRPVAARAHATTRSPIQRGLLKREPSTAGSSHDRIRRRSERLRVEPICRELPIPSTSHAERARRADPAKAAPRVRRDLVLRGEIRRVWQENFGVYGVRKVWRQLGREGVGVARCTVAPPDAPDGPAGNCPRTVRENTIGDKAFPCPLDRVNRDFKAPAPNRLWVSDFT